MTSGGKIDNNRASQTSNSRFDVDTIGAGLSFMIQNPGHITKLYKFIDPGYFFLNDSSVQIQALRRLISVILDIHKYYGAAAITPAFCSTKLAQQEDSEVAEEAKRLFDRFLSNPKVIEKVNDRGCQMAFLDFLKIIQIIKWSEEFMPKYKKGDIEHAVKSMKDLTSLIDHIRFEDNVESIDAAKMSLDDLKGFLTVPTDTKGEIFLLGDTQLDRDLGGFERRGLHLFIAATNGGKSMMTQHLLLRCIEQGMTAHIAVAEDHPKSFYRRLFASLTGIESQRLKFHWDNLSKDELSKIEWAQQKIQEHIHVDLVYGESLETIHQKKREYDANRVARGLKPYDVDIVDYSGHIADKSRGEKSYEQYRNAYAERKNYGLINNKIVFDFAQVNRKGHEKKQNAMLLTHGELAGGYDLSQVCDNIISINRFPEDIDKNLATLLITKAKDGKIKSDGYKIGTDFARARWIMNTPAMNIANMLKVEGLDNGHANGVL